MKLSQLLEIHQQERAPGSLVDHFGDSYLLNHNSIYREIRRRILELNYAFSSERDDLYNSLPLAQLDRILDQRKIPYSNNVAAIELVCQQWPQVSWQDIQAQFKKNYLFHESCHAVARSMAPTVGNEEERLVVRLLEEAFANTCELLALLDVQDKPHRCFYEMTSYILMYEAKSELQRLSQDIGGTHLFRWMMLSYLLSNALYEKISETDFDKMLQLTFQSHSSDVSVPQKKALRSIAKIAFNLNPDFLEVTSSFYLKVVGFKDPTATLRTMDVLSHLEKNSQILEFFHQLAGIRT